MLSNSDNVRRGYGNMSTLKIAGYVNAVFCSVIMMVSSGLIATAYGLRECSIKYDVFLYYYSTLTSLTVIITASVEFVVGLLGFVASILCFRRLLFVYTTFICIMSLTKTIVIGTSYFLNIHEIWSVEENFMNHFTNSTLIYDTQRELKCCGIKAATDWLLILDTCIPESCFKHGKSNYTTTHCDTDVVLDDVYLRGCVRELELLAPQIYLLTITNLLILQQTVQVSSLLMSSFLQARLVTQNGFSKLSMKKLIVPESSVEVTGFT